MIQLQGRLHFWGDLDHHANSPNRESGQYVDNVLFKVGQGGLCSLSALVYLFCEMHQKAQIYGKASPGYKNILTDKSALIKS